MCHKTDFERIYSWKKRVTNSCLVCRIAIRMLSRITTCTDRVLSDPVDKANRQLNRGKLNRLGGGKVMRHGLQRKSLEHAKLNGNFCNNIPDHIVLMIAILYRQSIQCLSLEHDYYFTRIIVSCMLARCFCFVAFSPYLYVCMFTSLC